MVLLEQVLLHAEEGERDAQQPKDHHGDPAGGFFAEFLQHRSGMSGRSGPVYPEWQRRAPRGSPARLRARERSAEHTSELQSLMRISYAVFCLKKNKINNRDCDGYIIKYIVRNEHNI